MRETHLDAGVEIEQAPGPLDATRIVPWRARASCGVGESATPSRKRVSPRAEPRGMRQWLLEEMLTCQSHHGRSTTASGAEQIRPGEFGFDTGTNNAVDTNGEDDNVSLPEAYVEFGFGNGTELKI